MPNYFLPGQSKVLANGVVTNLLSVTVALNTTAAGLLMLTIESISTANVLQSRAQQLVYQVSNTGGTVTSLLTASGNTTLLGSGTLAAAWSITAANPAILRLAATSSLTSALLRVFFTFINLGSQEVLVL